MTSRQHLVALAKEQDIPFKLDIYPFLWFGRFSGYVCKVQRLNTPFSVLVLNLVHSYERTHIDSVVATERMVDAILRVHW